MFKCCVCAAVMLTRFCAGYIFESQMVTELLKLFPQAPYRNVALQCLTEVSCLLEYCLARDRTDRPAVSFTVLLSS